MNKSTGIYSPLFLSKIFAAQLLGFRYYIPPYARTRGRALLMGVNYASGASGIRNETGNNLVFNGITSRLIIMTDNHYVQNPLRTALAEADANNNNEQKQRYGLDHYYV